MLLVSGLGGGGEAGGEALVVGGGFFLCFIRNLIGDALMNAFICCAGDDFRLDFRTMFGELR